MTAPVPASSCTEAEKVDETIMSLFTREIVACMKFQTESYLQQCEGPQLWVVKQRALMAGDGL